MDNGSIGDAEYKPRRGRPQQPCRHCGSSERSEKGQLACANAHLRQRRAADPAYRIRANGYQRAHAHRRKAAGIPRVMKRRPSASKEYKAARRELERNAAGFHTSEQLAVILQTQGGRCTYCRKRARLQRDHMTPLSRRGSDWPWNIQLLCAFHNSSKGELTDGEYREREGLPARQWMDHPYYALVVAALI